MKAAALLLAALLSCLLAALASASSADIDKEFQKVTCGSMVKLLHEKSGYRLHSHEIPYGTGSGQQSITGYPNSADTNSYFVVRAAHGESCRRGEPIRCGGEIRLQHSNTKRYLHSHLHGSPLSRNQEVSGYLPGDTGDNWVVVCAAQGARFLDRETSFRLQHKDTGMYLSASKAHTFGHPIQGQIEVAAIKAASAETVWQVVEGIYIAEATK